MIPTDMERFESEIAGVLSNVCPDDENKPTESLYDGPTMPTMAAPTVARDSTAADPGRWFGLAPKPAAATVPDQSICTRWCRFPPSWLSTSETVQVKR